MENQAAPFNGLTPDCILDALQSVGFISDGRLLALNSYENRVYQVGMEDGPPIVVKFYRPKRWSNEAILEEHAFVRELADREIPVVAPLELEDASTLAEYLGFRFAIYPRKGGRAPELDRKDTLEWMGRFIGRIHACGAARPFSHRPSLDKITFGEQPKAYLLEQGFIPAELKDSWTTIIDIALRKVEACFARAGTVEPIRLHGDCHGGNVLWTDAGPHFVDFDDSRMGPAIQDLWMLLSGSREEMKQQLNTLLDGYEDFYELNPRELHLVEALRTLRLIHYSAWLASRQDDPAFHVAFPFFNTIHYWQDRILELREQVALMDEPPLISTLSG